MSMPRISLVAAVLAAFSNASVAIEYDLDEGTEAHVPTAVHDLALVSPEEPIDARVQADLDYAAGMKQHHEGALTMSRDYLTTRSAPTRSCARWRAVHRQPALRDRHAGRRRAACGRRAAGHPGPRLHPPYTPAGRG